jgi:hypothetical protein
MYSECIRAGLWAIQSNGHLRGGQCITELNVRAAHHYQFGQCHYKLPRSLCSNSQRHSTLSVDFQIDSESVFSIRGSVTGPANQSEVRLTGPNGIVAQHFSNNTTVNTCGALSPGQYNVHISSFGAAGSFSFHNVTMRIAKPGDVTLDDAVNVVDLLAVINAWGTCPNPQTCDADLTCDGMVNVADLLNVISNWD